MKFLICLILFFSVLANDVMAYCQNDEQAMQDFSTFFTSGNQQRDLDGLVVYLNLSGPGCWNRVKENPAFDGYLRTMTMNHLRALISGRKKNLTEMVRIIRNVDTRNIITTNNSVQAVVSTINNLYASKAERCKNQNLKEALPASSINDGSNWSVANAASDIATQRTGQNISSLDILMQTSGRNSSGNSKTNHIELYRNRIEDFSITQREMDLEMIALTGSLFQPLVSDRHRRGRVSRAMDSVSKQGGFCLESELPSHNSEAAELLTELTSLTRNIEQNYRNRMEDGENLRASVLRDFCNEEANPLRQAFPSILAGDVVRIMENDPNVDLLFAMTNEQCRNRRAVDFTSMETYGVGTSPYGFSEVIDNALNANTPAVISYYQNFMTTPNNSISARLNSVRTSTVVGRRWSAVDQQCQYLLRPSRGSDCSQYIHPYSKQCEDGHVWVNESELENNTFEAEVFR